MATVQQVQVPNLYGTVANAPPLPVQFQVQPAPIIGGNDLKAIQDQHQMAYQQAMQFGQMNPEMVMAALQPGGSLSSSLGFSNVGDVGALTPDQLMALTQGRGVNQSLQGAKQTMDAVTNAPEIRQMMTHSADQNFNVNAQMLAQQQAQALQAQTANAGHAMQLATDQTNLSQRAAEFNAGATNTHMNQLEQIHSNERIAANSNAIQLQGQKLQLQMERERIAASTQSAQTIKQWDIRQNDQAAFEKLMTTPNPTQASTDDMNSIMKRQPGLNQQGVWYKNGHDNVLGSHVPIPVPLKAGTYMGVPVWFQTETDGKTVSKDAKGNPIIHSARQ